MKNEYRATLMSCDTPIAHINGDRVTAIVPDLMPFMLKRSSSFENWLLSRTIDLSRTNSRLLRKVLSIKSDNEAELILAVCAAAITDTYWVKPDKSDLSYRDVRFKNDFLSNLALLGGATNYTDAERVIQSNDGNREIIHTPELTTVGSYEKGWKNIDGVWWLYKKADRLGLFSELFVYELGKRLGFPMAEYEPVDGSTIRSRDFTNGASVNYEPASALVGESQDYIENYELFKSIKPELADQYLEIIFMDGVCQNVDRHTFNYGVLREISTGNIIALAPNFDNNNSLVSGGYPKTIGEATLLQTELSALEAKTGAFSSYARRHRIPQVTRELVNACIDAAGVNVRRETVCNMVTTRFAQTPFDSLKCFCKEERDNAR